MWVYILSVLAIKSVQSATIGYPYRSLWTYDPLKSGSIHGYLRYLDNSAAGLNNQQPVYAVPQIKYFNSAAPAPETLIINNSDEVNNARETYLRAASLQQYQNLKSILNALKAEGKEPSAEKLSKLQMLQKIAFTSDFSLIAELPEIKSTLQDLEVSISGLHRDYVQKSLNEPKNVDQSQGEIKTYAGNSNIPLVAIDETPEQKQAHEDHLRIYNEQIANLKHLELEHQKYVEEASAKFNIPQSSNVDKPIIEQLDNSKALAELERAQQEHLRIWNETKLRAEQAGYESGEKGVYERANNQQISELTNDQNIYSPKQVILNKQNPETQQFSKQFAQQNLKSDIPTLEYTQQQLNDKSNLKNEEVRAADPISGQNQLVDFSKIVRAREKDMRTVNEAIAKIETEPQVSQKPQHLLDSSSKEEKKTKTSLESLSQQLPIAKSQSIKDVSSALNYKAEQSFVEETAEVKKAREEHLRLVHEANLRAQYVEQQELKYKHESQTPILKSQYKNQQHSVYHPETSQNFQQNSRTFPNPSSEEKPIIDFAVEENRLLELERLREAERFQKEQQMLEMDRLCETARLAEEKRQMEADLMRLRLEDEQRLEMERLMEEKRLQQEELQEIRNGGYQEIIIQNDSIDQQPQIAIISTSNVAQTQSQQNSEVVEEQSQKYNSNPFLKVGKVSSEPATLSEQAFSPQSFLLKNVPIQNISNTQQYNSVTSKGSVPSDDYTVRHYIPSSYQSSGSEYQYIKDENNKHIYHSPASSQAAHNDHYIPLSHYSSGIKHQYMKDDNIKHNHHSAGSSQSTNAEHFMPSSHHSSGIKYQYIKDDNIKHIYHSAASSQIADNEHYIPSLHHPSGSKYQYMKDENNIHIYHSPDTPQTVDNKHYDPSSHHSSEIKHQYINDASSQTADTSEALNALEKATNDHLRAHELVLEQLRLARLQSLSMKDCN